ncbi:MAG: type II toxin-antitoxin system VapC family toxin [Candidatus Helarchaeota archaeon]
MTWLLDTNALIKSAKLLKKRKIFRRNLTFTTIFCLIEYPIAIKFEALTIIYPNTDDYKNALKYAFELREHGTPLPAIDVLIATIAINRSKYLVTNDEHFKFFQDIEPRLKIISMEELMVRIQKIERK